MPRINCALCTRKPKTLGEEVIQFHKIPYKKDAGLASKWSTNLQIEFDERKHHHICDLHFTDDQFDEGHVAFLKLQNISDVKRKLKPDGSPSIREPKGLSPYLMSAQTEYNKTLKPAQTVSAKSHKVYSKGNDQRNAADDDVQFPEIDQCDFQNLPTSTPLKRGSVDKEAAGAAKRQMLNTDSPGKLSDEDFSIEFQEKDNDSSFQPGESLCDNIEDSAEISFAKLKHIFTPEENAGATKNVICNVEQLQLLLKRCQECGAEYEETSKRKFATGAQLTFEQTCKNHHTSQWRTSETKNKVPLINVQITAATLCSGISFAEWERFSHVTDMATISRTTYDNHKRNFCYPIIKNKYWEMRMEILELMKKMTGGLVFTGDGRFDSPGKNSAKFCGYTILEALTNLIVDFIVFQKNLKPGEMESEAFKLVFQRVVDEVTAEKIKVFCSDRSMTVGRKMKDYFKTVNHAFDIWHLAKGANRSLKALSNKFPGIQSWRKSIINHLWYAAQNCDEQADELIRIWESMIFHVQNIHEWVDKKGVQRKCLHSPLSQEKTEWTDWIDSEIEIHALKKALFNTRFINQLKQCRFFIHTSTLESFHNVLLMYAPKRIAYTYEGMVVRTILAILDHNANVGRDVIGDKVRYSKAAKEYRLHDQYEPKDPTWRKDLVEQCVEFVKNTDLITFNPDIDALLLPFDLPKNIVPSDIVKPSIEEMREKKQQNQRM